MFYQDLDIGSMITMLRRRWWVIILFAFLSVAVVYYYVSRLPLIYTASATILVSPAKSSSSSQYTDLIASERLALTYSQMIKDQPVLAKVIEQLGLTQSTDTLADKIQIERIRDTQLIRITVSDSDPTQAAQIANSLAQVFKERVESLSTERYSSTIQNAQDQVKSLQTPVADFESQGDSLQAQKVDKEIQLKNKQTALDSLRRDYQNLQYSRQQLDLSISEATGRVYVFEPVQVKKDLLKNTNNASATVYVGQVQMLKDNTGPSHTLEQLLLKTTTLEKIRKEANLSISTEELAKKVSIDLVSNSQFVRLTASDADPVTAEQIDNALINAFIAQMKELFTAPYADRMNTIEAQMDAADEEIDVAQSEISELTEAIAQLNLEISRAATSLTEYRSDLRGAQKNLEEVRMTAVESSDTVVLSEPAHAPKGPSQNYVKFIGVAAVIGLAIGVAFAFLLSFFDDRIRTAQDISKQINLPILGAISRFDHGSDDLVLRSKPASISADDFRVLSMHINRLCVEQGLRTLLVTSPTPMEGKSVVSSNLAMALAKNGLKVIAVDADMRLPHLHDIFGLNNDDGLANALKHSQIDGCLQNTQLSDLKVFTSGERPDNPAELLALPGTKKLFRNLAEIADIILIDCPPVLSVADASILAPQVDGVLLVLKSGKTKSQTAKSAIKSLQQIKANLIGGVLNVAPERREGYYHYYHK